MNPESPNPPPTGAAEPVATLPAVLPAVAPGGAAAPVVVSRPLAIVFVALLSVALVVSGLLWQKLSAIQEHLARQSADAGAQSVEARTIARQAQAIATETAARQAAADIRLSEVSLQRSQLEDLMQSLSRSRDENLVVDLESALRLAQQQAQLTGSVEPLVAALRTADQRVSRAAQPRLARLRAAMARDMDRIKSASVTDTPGLLVKLDDLVRQADELPIVNAVGAPALAAAARPKTPTAELAWWQRGVELVREEARGLVRVSQIREPDAVLLSPEQSFFLRENLKLKLLNARLSLLARQSEAARADMASAAAALGKYFDPAARKTQVAATLMQQVQSQLKAVELPRLDETLAALAAAASGR